VRTILPIAMVAAVIVATSAAAAGKPYTVVISPASIPGGEPRLP